MRRTFALLLTAVTVAASAQSIVLNGTFTDSLGNCSLEHWSSFCNAFMLTDGCSGCAIGIAPNNGPNPCPYATSPTGLHTRLEDPPVGVPMELSLCAILGSADVGDVGDVGIFYTDPGETPTGYYGDGIVQVWPIVGANGAPVNNIINFTIPLGYAGKDFWLFLEYSFAPDNGLDLKIYDDIVIAPVITTGIGECSSTAFVSLDPVQRTIAIASDQASRTVIWEVWSMTGARLAEAIGDEVVHADAWAHGVYLVRAQLRDGTVIQRRLVL